jgi:ABC-type polysaccharide/polyol phosphate export permease
MIKIFKELVHDRDLLYMLTWKEIRIRYKQSVMGFLWAILMPLMIVSAGIVMKQAYSFAAHHRVDLQDLLSVSVKAVLWSFFVAAVKFGANSLIANTNLVTKIYFPREILPLSCVFANLFDLCIAGGFVALLMLVAKVGLSYKLVWVPLILLVLVMLTASVAVILACANLFFRDVKYIVEVIFTYGILLTPVLYSAKAFGKWAPALLLNPVGSVLECINDVVVSHQNPDPVWLSYAAVCGVAGLFVALAVFKKAEPSFAQEI